MSDYFALAQIFTERYTDYGLRWPLSMDHQGGRSTGTLIGEGTHFMIPRQGQVELKWTFTALESTELLSLAFDPPLRFKVCFDDYERWVASYPRLGTEAWLNQWLIEAAAQVRDDVCRAVSQGLQQTARVAVAPQAIRLTDSPDYVETP